MRSEPIRSARSLRTQYLIAAVIPALIVTLSITGFVWAQKPVTVIVDGQTYRVKTQATDVAGLLRQADVAVGVGDVVTPVPDAPVNGGMTVIVRHSTPVTLNLGGRTIALNVVGKSVADALVAAGIDPAANPAVSPALSAKLERNMTITAPKAFKRVSREQVKVPYGRRTRRDSRLPAGVRKVVTKGRPGAGLRLYTSARRQRRRRPPRPRRREDRGRARRRGRRGRHRDTCSRQPRHRRERSGAVSGA